MQRTRKVSIVHKNQFRGSKMQNESVNINSCWLALGVGEKHGEARQRKTPRASANS